MVIMESQIPLSSVETPVRRQMQTKGKEVRKVWVYQRKGSQLRWMDST